MHALSNLIKCLLNSLVLKNNLICLNLILIKINSIINNRKPKIIKKRVLSLENPKIRISNVQAT